MSAGVFDMLSLVGVIPTFIGYEPAPGQGVLIAIAEQGDRSTLGAVAVFQMGAYDAAQYRGHLLPGLLGEDVAGVILVGYEGRSGTGQTTAEAERLSEALAETEGVRVLRAVWVVGGRMREEGDPLGARVPGVGELPQAAELVYSGHASAGSRANLEAAFRAGSGSPERVEAVRASVEALRGAQETTTRGASFAAAGLLCRLDADPVQSWPAEALAALLVGVSDVELRDSMTGWLVGDARPDGFIHPTFQALVGSPAFEPAQGDQMAMIERLRVAYVSAPRGSMAAQLGALLALYAWTCGNGAVANIVQADATSMDPSNTLLQLLGHALRMKVRGNLFAKA